MAGKTKGAETVNPGSDPSSNPSSDPDSDPCSDPGSIPGSDPSSNPGFILSLSPLVIAKTKLHVPSRTSLSGAFLRVWSSLHPKFPVNELLNFFTERKTFIREKRNFELENENLWTQICDHENSGFFGVLKIQFSNSIINNSSTLNKGNHDRDGVWISDLNQHRF